MCTPHKIAISLSDRQVDTKYEFWGRYNLPTINYTNLFDKILGINQNAYSECPDQHVIDSAQRLWIPIEIKV